ncbi:hypothetical protein FOVG_15219 [Fusarium oxysporum f. sp. pisi HDV247]|uniref:ubiquitinyl hydrolase 1 n=1 Tax=Fusarium oxysporum f. sp. pisi HDV247 TaxID=1080344 RepID=W9P0J0_FUSOX|nr:hypothetical protein FOVG_15219 [Fusarium oxysporum f. sp. pisi HDV247]
MDASHQTPLQTMLCTEEQLDYLFHHLILPAKLPGHDDTLALNEEFLINFVIQILARFGELSGDDDDHVAKHCISMLKNTRDARDSNGYLDSRSVQNSLKRLSEQADAASMYHITEQNAGLIIRRLESSYSSQTFELSPTNKAAMTTKGRLIREFPATVTEVSAKDFNNSSFQEVLTKTLVKMSHQAVAEMQPKVKKAQQMHNEERDTTDSRIVTELLTSFLRGAGIPEAKGTTLDTSLLLQMVSSMSPNTRVILDVGAQVVDLTNQEFAKQWLACYQDHNSTQAVVFFNDNDEIVVIDRSGKIEDFQTSPFSQQLDRCLVFLDEAHTRGTDLKLPANYRAVVTLGAGLTKDRLVQACMRMRKLGKGQTVEFCIPWEIEQKIVQLKGEGASSRDGISVSDVLCWAVTETCLDLKRAMPLWLTQGVRFSKQEALWSRLSHNYTKSDEFLEEEGQSLTERYRPEKGLINLSSLTEELNDSAARVFKSRARTTAGARDTARAPSRKVPALKPDTHSVNWLLQEWIADGSFPESSTAFRAVMKPAFQSLNKTSAAVHFDVKEFPETVWVSMDFAHTVKGVFSGKSYSDSYQRPVQWVLTGKNEEGASRMVVISPFEAQHFLPLIEESEHVALHLYAPRVNLGFRPLDDFQLYSVGKKIVEEIPRDIITFLNLFAGQTYLSSYDDYKLVCDLLGLAWDSPDDSAVLGAGGSGSQSGFSKSPATFLKELSEKVRQDCGTIDKTDMGSVIEGVRLVEGEFNSRHAI